MPLKGSSMTHCSKCSSLLSIISQFRIPPRHPTLKITEIYYLRCDECNQLYMVDYFESKLGGCSWGRIPINRVHQLEGFIPAAYWRFHTGEVAEPEPET